MPDSLDTAATRTDVWLDSVEIRLAGDRDADGYHSRLIVTLDVDTDGGFASVQAGIALVDGRGRVALAYDTDPFGVRGRASADRLGVEFELLDDFPSERYGLHVELRDASYGDVLDGVGPNEFANLGGLRLEGTRRDGHDHGSPYGDGPGYHGTDYGIGFFGDYPYGHAGGIRDDAASGSFVATSYTGAADPAGLAVLAAFAAAALRRRVRRRA